MLSIAPAILLPRAPLNEVIVEGKVRSSANARSRALTMSPPLSWKEEALNA